MSESDSETEDQCPNKVDILKEMFPLIESSKLTSLLWLLNGNVQKVITLCLDGLSGTKLLRAFKHVKMSTRVKRVAVDVDHILRDALSFYKSSAFDVGRPVEVELLGSEALDLGGPRRQFFNIVIEGLAKNEVLRLFQGDLDDGHLLPAINHDAIICGHFKMAGRMILHSILNEGPAFPLFPAPIYHYMVNGTIESALSFMDIKYLPPRARVVVDQVS